MKLVIAGSRTIECIEILRDAIDLFYICNVDAVISGTAKGVDTLGEIWAKSNNIAVERYPADWDNHGRSAGPIRNSQMAEIADAGLIIWDGESRGTNHMISQLKRLNKPCFLLTVDVSYERIEDTIVKVYQYGGRTIIEYTDGSYKFV